MIAVYMLGLFSLLLSGVVAVAMLLWRRESPGAIVGGLVLAAWLAFVGFVFLGWGTE